VCLKLGKLAAFILGFYLRGKRSRFDFELPQRCNLSGLRFELG
jgi:hypothetical protein